VVVSQIFVLIVYTMFLVEIFFPFSNICCEVLRGFMIPFEIWRIVFELNWILGGGFKYFYFHPCLGE